jgi:hypothetical protein
LFLPVLNGFGAGLAGPDTDGLLEIDDEDLAVPDLAGACGVGDGLDDLLGNVISDGEFDLA